MADSNLNEVDLTPVASITKKRYVGIKETVLYGVANGGQVFGLNFIRTYFLYFCTSIFVVPNGPLTAVILALGIWDAINDPLMGGIIDKTRSRYGKMRPYLLLSPLPLAIITILLFSGPFFIGANANTAKVVYVLITYLMWDMIYTIGDVPFWGMSAAISPNPEDRTRVISSARLISSILGGLSTTLFTVLLELSDKGVLSMDAKGVFLLMAVVCGVFGCGLFAIAGFATKERVPASIDEPSLSDSFKNLFKNKPLLLLVLSSVLSSLGGLTGFFQIYYFRDVFGSVLAYTIISIPGTIMGFLAYVFLPWLKRKMSNKQLLVFMHFFRLIITSAMFFVVWIGGVKNPYVVYPAIIIQMFLLNFTNGIQMVIPTEMIGDTVDYMEWKTGARTEGMSFSVLTFVGKLTNTVASTLGLALLPLIGYAAVSNTLADGTVEEIISMNAGTEIWIWALYSIIPAALSLLSLIPLIFYPINSENHKQMLDEIAERKRELELQIEAEAIQEEM